jgi:hypothetical protein
MKITVNNDLFGFNFQHIQFERKFQFFNNDIDLNLAIFAYKLENIRKIKCS